MHTWECSKCGHHDIGIMRRLCHLCTRDGLPMMKLPNSEEIDSYNKFLFRIMRLENEIVSLQATIKALNDKINPPKKTYWIAIYSRYENELGTTFAYATKEEAEKALGDLNFIKTISFEI